MNDLTKANASEAATFLTESCAIPALLPKIAVQRTSNFLARHGNDCLEVNLTSHLGCETINLELRSHQQTIDDWNFRQVAFDLHQWAERMVLEFKLEIPPPCLAIEYLGRGRLGHFRRGRNGFGLRDEIAIDQKHLNRGPLWDVYGTLLHELLHSWQEHHGRPGRRNYHNKEFRDKACSLGLLIDEAGHTRYAAGETPFALLMYRYGIERPAEDAEVSSEIVVTPVPPCGSTLKLYACPCGVKVRVGRSRFNARCLDCGGLFQRKETNPTIGDSAS